MPVGNGGKFTQESREIYELVREMQTVRGHARATCQVLTLPTPGVLQGDRTGPALGRGTTVVPPHTRAGLQEAWYLQSGRRRGGAARGGRERGVLPARRRSLAGSRCARRAEREQARAQPDDRAR